MSQLLFSIAAILAEGADCEKHFGSPQSGSPKSPGTLSSHECEPVEYFDVCVDSCTPDSTGDMCRESCLVMIVGIRECISKCHTSKASERGCSQRCFHSTAWSNYSTTDFIANLCSRDDCDGICRQFNSTTAGATCMGFDANADNTCPSFTVLCDTTTEPSGPVNVKLSLSTTTTTQSIGNTTGVGIDNAPSIDSAGITGITGAILVLLFLAFVTVRRGKRQKLEDADHEANTVELVFGSGYEMMPLRHKDRSDVVSTQEKAPLARHMLDSRGFHEVHYFVVQHNIVALKQVLCINDSGTFPGASDVDQKGVNSTAQGYNHMLRKDEGFDYRVPASINSVHSAASSEPSSILVDRVIPSQQVKSRKSSPVDSGVASDSSSNDSTNSNRKISNPTDNQVLESIASRQASIGSASINSTDLDALIARRGSNGSLSVGSGDLAGLLARRGSFDSVASICSGDLAALGALIAQTETEASEGGVAIDSNAAKKEIIISWVNLPDGQGNTPLIWAVRVSSVEIVEFLISVGANIHASNRQLQTPLHFACMISSENSAVASKLINILLAAGGDPDAKDTDGRSAFSLAAGTGVLSSFNLLLAAGASLQSSDTLGMTPMMLATQGGHLSVVQRGMQSSSLLIDESDRQGWTILHWAAAIPDSSVLRFLLEVPTVKPQAWLTVHGESALHVAARQGNIHSALIMLKSVPQKQRMAMLELQRHDGLTAVTLAGARGNELMIAVSDGSFDNALGVLAGDRKVFLKGASVSSSIDSSKQHMQTVLKDARDSSVPVDARMIDELEAASTILSRRLAAARAEHAQLSRLVHESAGTRNISVSNTGKQNSSN